MGKCRALILGLASTGLAGCAHLASPSEQTLFVISRETSALHRIPVAGKAAPSVLSVSRAPHEVAVSPDGRLIYLPIYGDGILGQPGSDGRSVEVIDASSLQPVGTIDLGAPVRPHGIVVAPNGLLWVTAELTREVLVVDPAARKVVARISTDQEQSHNLALSPDGQRAYTSNVSAGTISIIDVPNRQLLAVVPVARRTQRVSVSRDSRWVFTHDTDAPRIAVIDARTQAIARWIELPRPGYASAATPDGRHLLVASPTRQVDARGKTLSRLFVIDMRSWTLEHTIEPGCAPVDLAVESSGRTAYLSCPSGSVVPVDLKAKRALTPIPMPRGIDGIALPTGAG